MTAQTKEMDHPRMTNQPAAVTLTDFLNARLDEDETVARSAFRQTYWLVAEDFTVYAEAEMTLQLPVADMWTQESADHVGRWDPERVLREVEAKRRILAEHAPVTPGPACRTCPDIDRRRGYSVIRSWPCDTVLALAAVYSDHEAFDPAWSTN
jgi:Family of unknown function (DUF6221)